MTTKKFSDLSELTTLENGDLFAVTDVGGPESKHILASNVSNYVLSEANITAKANTIVTKINALNPTTGNGLKAQELFVNDAYRAGSYFLNYANLTGKPTIPVDTATFGTVDGFTNAGNLVSFDATAATPRMAVSGTGSTAQGMTSDYVTEGNVNEFYTNAKVDARLDLNFGNLFNSYSNSFDGGEVRESLQDVIGQFQGIVSDQSNIFRITDKTLEPNFSPGQLLRIYGASSAANVIAGSPTVSLNLVTFTSGTGTGYKSFEYKVAYFNLKTGEVGAPSGIVSANVYNEDLDVLTAFNTNYFIGLNISGQSGDQGVLVYRQIAGEGDFKLLAILGPKELQSQWKDYHTFDYTSWSGKNPTDNTFLSTTHFPLTAHTGTLRGWTDATISSINSQGGFFELNFGTTFVYVDSGGAAQVAHNDTNRINDAILTKSAQGRKSVELNAKTYNVSHVNIPDNFGLVGTANITKVKKLPFSGYYVNSPDNSVFKSSSVTDATSISLSGIDVDGNIKSQFLHNDDTDATINYIIDFGANPSSILIDRCRIKNIAGGGIYATNPTELKISTSEVCNSALTDRFPFSPLVADSGTSTLVTGSRFENFTESVDVSVTTQGVIANNIIKACGAGLFTYGSTFLVSSPNVLIGAANEFLSSPDILNSEYDIINIPTSLLGSVAPYNSDPFTYQENGAAFNLSQTSVGTIRSLEYRAKLIRKLSNGAEEEYGNEVGPAATGINAYGFATVTNDGLIAGKRYTIITPGDTNWAAIGAPNANVGTVFKADFTVTTPTGTTGLASGEEFVGYPNQNAGTTGTATLPIYIKDVDVGVDRALGEFKFQINDTEGGAASWTNVKTGIYSQGSLDSLYAANTKTSVSDTSKIHPFGSSHVGIHWSTSYRYYVDAGTIQTIGIWTYADTTNPTYTVTVTPTTLNVPLAAGNVVKIQGSTNFALGSAVGGSVGEITSITPSGVVNKILTIKFWKGGTGSGNAGVLPGTATGTINIIDDFIMAQGLIK